MGRLRPHNGVSNIESDNPRHHFTTANTTVIVIIITVSLALVSCIAM